MNDILNIVIIIKEEEPELTYVTTPTSNDVKVFCFSNFLSKGAESLVDLTQFK